MLIHRPEELFGHDRVAHLVGVGEVVAGVGAYLLALWGLPNLVIEAVALQEHPARRETRAFSPMIAVHAARAFAHALAATRSEGVPPQLDLQYLTQAGFGERIDRWRETCLETGEA